ncbi:MAG: pyridoxine 5'-phosphate synthase [Myxococcota bacterium]
MPAKLSVNINKYALLRNSRGGHAPDLIAATETCIAAGAHGITVHPRRDQRHVRFEDVPVIARHLRSHHPTVELNVECEDHPLLLELVRQVHPDQCTLVPVNPGEITSDHGWDLPASLDRLRRACAMLRAEQIRSSCFADCDPERIPRFAEAGTDRVELYTGPYAWAWGTRDQERERALTVGAAAAATACGLGVNAGHDLDRHNLAGLVDVAELAEVSIGHAQICRALEVGTTQSVRELLAALGWPTTAAAPAP